MNERILRRIVENEPERFVVPGSTPVISFGDFTKAKLLTVSINPSSLEFATKGKLFPETQKRLVDKEALGIDLRAELLEEHAERIWKGCQAYFKVNPYIWFESIGSLLSTIEYSYLEGNAAHVDLVQWSTFPAWKDIPKEAQRNFITKDLNFLEYQISMPNVEILVVNGLQVVNTLKELNGFKIEVKEELKYKSGDKSKTCRLLVGVGPHGKKIVGWTSTIKSLQVSNEERSRIYKELGSWIARNA